MTVEKEGLARYSSLWRQSDHRISGAGLTLVYLSICAVIFGGLVYLARGWLTSFSLRTEQAAFWDIMIKGIGGAIAIVGGIVGLSKYFYERAKANQAALIEAQKPFSEKRQEVYFQLVSAASTIANRIPGEPERGEAEVQFWWLFWGGVPMVADDQVSAAVDNFATVLHKDPTHINPNHGELLRNAAMDLARACRQSLRFVEY